MRYWGTQGNNGGIGGKTGGRTGGICSLAVLIFMLSGPAGAQDVRGVVTRVIDGDSIVVGKIEMRLWGIDAPEWNAPGGAAATAFLRRLIAGKPVSCTVKDVDRYKRAVVQCFVGGKDVAGALVAAGLARDWPRYSKGFYGGKDKSDGRGK